MRTGPQAGVTTEAISSVHHWKGCPIKITDTAGLSRKEPVKTTLPFSTSGTDRSPTSPLQDRALYRLSAKETEHALCFTHVALIVIDASQGIQHQDCALVQQAVQEGRSVVIALNKWDKVRDPAEILSHLPKFWAHHPVCPISCVNGEGLENLWDTVVQCYKDWNQRISTGALNRWLMKAISEHSPPLVRGRRIKIRYITQIKTRPPTFTIFGNQLKMLPLSYHRYLSHSLQKHFSLVNVRLRFHTTENPYV